LKLSFQKCLRILLALVLPIVTTHQRKTLDLAGLDFGASAFDSVTCNNGRNAGGIFMSIRFALSFSAMVRSKSDVNNRYLSTVADKGD
jgi:hypothetical protein